MVFVCPEVFENVIMKRGSRPFMVASEVAIHAIVWQIFSSKIFSRLFSMELHCKVYFRSELNLP